MNSKKKIIEKPVTTTPVVKKAPGKKTTAKKVNTEAIPSEGLNTAQFQKQTMVVFSHLLSVLKAMLIDSFRQWVMHKIENDLPLIIDEFLEKFRESAVLHGITKKDLEDKLEPYQVDYANAGKEVESESLPVDDGLSDLNFDDFGLGPVEDTEVEPEVEPVKKATKKEESIGDVFGSLDIL